MGSQSTTMSRGWKKSLHSDSVVHSTLEYVIGQNLKFANLKVNTYANVRSSDKYGCRCKCRVINCVECDGNYDQYFYASKVNAAPT